MAANPQQLAYRLHIGYNHQTMTETPHEQRLCPDSEDNYPAFYDHRVCPECGARYSIPYSVTRDIAKTTRRFFCPFGHVKEYSAEEAEAILNRLDMADNRIAEYWSNKLLD